MLKVAVIGRTRMLLESAMLLREQGHLLSLVWTCGAEEFYDVDESDFAKLAEMSGSRFICEKNLGDPKHLARLMAAEADIAISVNWPTLIPIDVMQCFKFGILNAHAGDLPRFRGNACPNWAILSGERYVGLCIHRMAAELDAGPVVIRDRLPIDEQTYIGDIYGWLQQRTPALFAAAVNGLENQKLIPEAQSTDPNVWLRCYPRRPEDAAINWYESAEHVHRLIRASSRPFDGAFTYLEGRRLVRIWRAEKFDHLGKFLAVPGQVCMRQDNDPVIACGNGAIRLTEVSVEGCASVHESKRAIHQSLRNRMRLP